MRRNLLIGLCLPGLISLLGVLNAEAVSYKPSSPLVHKSARHMRPAPSGAKDMFYRQLRSSQPATSYGLVYSIQLTRNGQTSTVDSRFPFKSGDQIRFQVRPNIDGYMSIALTAGSTGARKVLFPNEAESGKNVVRKGEVYTLPANGALQFDDQPGTEMLQLALSKEPLRPDANIFSRSVTIRPKEQHNSINKYGKIQFTLDGQSTLVTTDTSVPFTVDLVLQHRSNTDNAEVQTTSNTPPSTDGDADDIEITSSSSAKIGDGQHTPIMDKWALVVGISKFKDPALNLRFPDKDARDFANFLVKEQHFAADHVKILTNEQATRQQIMTQLGSTWLPGNVKPGDLLLVFLAGHGSSAEQDTAKKNFFLAYDTDPTNLFATGIEMQDLTRTIKGRLDTDRVLIVLDACHSGAAETGAKSIFIMPKFNPETVMPGTGQLLIASSNANQVSFDSRRYQNGIFTHNLIAGLRKFPDLKSAFQFTKTAVESESLQQFGKQQTPVLKEADWKGPVLMLAAPPVQPRPARPN